MVDPVTLWPIRPVSRPARDDGASATRAGATAARRIDASASLPKLVNLASELARAGPPVDYARIAELRKAIALGDYVIDRDSIADAMAEHYRMGAASA